MEKISGAQARALYKEAGALRNMLRKLQAYWMQPSTVSRNTSSFDSAIRRYMLKNKIGPGVKNFNTFPIDNKKFRTF